MSSLSKSSRIKEKEIGWKRIECTFIGYAEHSKAYRFMVIEPNYSFSINTIIESRDAIFDETRFNLIPRLKELVTKSDKLSKNGEETIELWRSKRIKKQRHMDPISSRT